MSNNRNVDPRHILGIDVLRFAAAILVMWFHFGYLMGAHPNGVSGIASRKLVSFPELFDWSYFGWVGVEIFFVISGFVIAFSGERATPFSFFASRVVRLGPGVWICAPITAAIVLMFGQFEAATLIKQFLHSVFFLPFGPWIDTAQWTLGLEISFYFMVFLIISFADFSKIRTLALVIGSLSSAFAILSVCRFSGPFGELITRAEHSRLVDLFLFRYGLYFALGVFLWLSLVKSATRQNILWCCVFTLAGCAKIASSVRSGNEQLGSTYPWEPVCAIWIVGVVGIVVSVRWNAVLHRAPMAVLRALKTMGLMTFPLYLLHSIAGASIMGWMVASGMSRWTALATAMVFSLLTSWIVCSLLEPRLQWVVKQRLSAGHTYYVEQRRRSAERVGGQR
ncbi:acyltransferase family protein [Duganella aceris]|uniref:Acyltransferase n=1 Tax=Duganella aceris TaxID=2703883 RepID=A0ABX0FTL9_9BURK|nr:acyltransferase [Duganella aceris]NGZ88044.1 acyltransferase [Duganella aceris]